MKCPKCKTKINLVCYYRQKLKDYWEYFTYLATGYYTGDEGNRR